MEIIEEIRKAHVVIICFSSQSVDQAGHLHKEIRQALEIAEEKPERAIFIIPYPLDGCEIPRQLAKYHWAGNSSTVPYAKLLQSLSARAVELGVTSSGSAKKTTKIPEFYIFQKIVARAVPYSFYIGKYPVTNAQYKRFLDSGDLDETIWTDFPKFNEDFIQIGQWEREGLNWLQSRSTGLSHTPVRWNDADFGIASPDRPVVGVTWYEANAYCKWLFHSWKGSFEEAANKGLRPIQIRLPLELEWVTAAGGEIPETRYPWDEKGWTTRDEKEISRRANVNENIGHTTGVNIYPRGTSFPYRVMDMAGNVWEWQANFYDKQHRELALRGGSWKYYQYGARVSHRYSYPPDDRANDVGFRVVIRPEEEGW